MKRKICLILAMGLMAALLCAPAAFGSAENPTLSESRDVLFAADSGDTSISAEFVVEPEVDSSLLASLFTYASYTGAAYPTRASQDFTFSEGSPVGGHANVIVLRRMDSAGDRELEAGQGLVSLTNDSGTMTLVLGGLDDAGVATAVSAATNPDVYATLEGSEAVVTDAAAPWASDAAVGSTAGADPTLDGFLRFDGSAPVTYCSNQLAAPVPVLIATQMAHRAGQLSGRVLNWNVAGITDSVSASGPMLFVGTPQDLASMPAQILDELKVVPQADGTMKAVSDVSLPGIDPNNAALLQAVPSPFAQGQTVFVVSCPDGCEDSLIMLFAGSDGVSQLQGDIVGLGARGNVVTTSQADAGTASQAASGASAAGGAGQAGSASGSNDAFGQMASSVERQLGIPWWNALIVVALAVLLVILICVYLATGKKGKKPTKAAQDEKAHEAPQAADAQDAQAEDAAQDAQAAEAAEAAEPAETSPVVEVAQATEPAGEASADAADQAEQDEQPEVVPEAAHAPQASQVESGEPVPEAVDTADVPAEPLHADDDASEVSEPVEQEPPVAPAAPVIQTPLYDPDEGKASEDAYQQALEEFRRFREGL